VVRPFSGGWGQLHRRGAEDTEIFFDQLCDLSVSVVNRSPAAGDSFTAEAQRIKRLFLINSVISVSLW